MIKIMFVCHGNICRSPMAEFIMKDIVKKKGLMDQFWVASSATSREEIGKDVHYGTKQKLKEKEIPITKRKAVQLKQMDYDEYDYFIAMDNENLRNMKRICGDDPQHKMYKLLDFSKIQRDIADPWYTGDFNTTYEDLKMGCKALLEYIMEMDLCS